MKVAHAIILAAGRGSRMMSLTDDKPKCMVQLLGSPLITWQLTALKRAGINKILVVRGYMSHLIKGDFETIDNPLWEDTNMVNTLLMAGEWLSRYPALVSYSDIVYRSTHVKKLSNSNADISLTFDTLWEELWRLRFDNPLNDAESFRYENGLLQEIGGSPDSINEIQGQYMGLLKFTPKGWSKIVYETSGFSSERLAAIDMTTLLQQLVDKQVPIEVIPIEGGWCEVDSNADLANYERIIAQCEKSDQTWRHDFR